jgi:hypothetical protein
MFLPDDAGQTNEGVQALPDAILQFHDTGAGRGVNGIVQQVVK